jgi:5'-3' exoribonuclease 1
LKKSGVQVFQQSSRGENLMLEISVNAEPDELVSTLFVYLFI